MVTASSFVATSDSWRIGPAGAAAFLAACDRAAVSGDLSGFKRDPAFRRVLEHVSQEQGAKYFELICAERPELTSCFPKFLENDRLGDPQTFAYGAWQFSPTTLRYVNVLADLIGRFSSLDGLDILEIGGGYGGQCKVIADACRFHSYTLVDLPEALELQVRYLTELNVPRFQCRRPDELAERDYDLAISNFALSELESAAQDYYFDRVLRRSQRGYLTWNGSTLPDLERLPHAATVQPERPQTGTDNRVIVWGPPPQAPVAITEEPLALGIS